MKRKVFFRRVEVDHDPVPLGDTQVEQDMMDELKGYVQDLLKDGVRMSDLVVKAERVAKKSLYTYEYDSEEGTDANRTTHLLVGETHLWFEDKEGNRLRMFDGEEEVEYLTILDGPQGDRGLQGAVGESAVLKVGNIENFSDGWQDTGRGYTRIPISVVGSDTDT